MEDYYGILGVRIDADQQAIRDAWRAKAHRFHPDHNAGDVESHDLFIRVRHAYKVLSDPFAREQYDRFRSRNISAMPQPGIQVHLEVIETNVYQEVRVSFTYHGVGKSFSRPEFDGFHFNEKPFVSVRNVVVNGSSTRETTFTYLIAPLRKGTMVIGAASVFLSGEKHVTSPLMLKAYVTKCAFSYNLCDEDAHVVSAMHLTLPAIPGRFSKGEGKRLHTVLIPRSKVAKRFHQLGRIMKIVFTLWGGFGVVFYAEIPLLIGLVIGNCLGGVNVQLMYGIAKVTSRGNGVRCYHGVSDYLGVGYVLGKGLAWPLDRRGYLERFASLLL